LFRRSKTQHIAENVKRHSNNGITAQAKRIALRKRKPAASMSAPACFKLLPEAKAPPNTKEPGMNYHFGFALGVQFGRGRSFYKKVTLWLLSM
jgi:hypothetical protein